MNQPARLPQSLASSQPFTVFVLELVSTGYFGDEISDSFRREGRAMLDAVTDVLSRIPCVAVETMQQRAVACRDGTLLRSVASIKADISLIIAPEFDGLLEQFCAAVRHCGARSLNCDPAALALGADKWAFARHLSQHHLPSIPTRIFSLAEIPAEFPCVIKPRFGAGSWLVRLIRDAPKFSAAIDEYRQAGLTELLCQPVIAGRPYSVAALVRPGHPPDILPIAEQHLSTDGEFRYLGGTIPADVSLEIAKKIHSLMADLINSLPGLNGYIGCDLIIREDGDPVFVELNPRVTTSYIGYRQLCADNLMERLLFPDRVSEPLRWKPDVVKFDAAGTLSLCRNDS